MSGPVSVCYIVVGQGDATKYEVIISINNSKLLVHTKFRGCEDTNTSGPVAVVYLLTSNPELEGTFRRKTKRRKV